MGGTSTAEMAQLNAASASHWEVDHQRVKLFDTGGKEPVLCVEDSAWNITITPGSYRLATGILKRRVDVSIFPLPAAATNPTAPHGLIGQSLHDTFAVNGKVDNYVPNTHGEFTTSAQGEGAIEGEIDDYEIVGDPFSTSFKFSRFEAAAHAPYKAASLSAQNSGKPLSAGTRFVSGAISDIPLNA